MEQNTVIETLKTSLLANIKAQWLFIVYFMITVIISVYIHFNLFQFFKLALGMFLFAGIVFLGFVAIAAHIKYYFYYERRRKVELFTDKMIIKVKDKVVEQLFKDDVTKITLYDKRHIDKGNLFPTLLDSYYYLIVIDKNQKRIILTCLLDIRLKKKIAAWYGQELEHVYQFFPFPLFTKLAES